MHIGEWDRRQVARVIASLDGEGFSQSQLGRMAGVAASTVSRWSRGTVRPGPDAARRLAVAVWRQHPDLARELVEASGYTWAEPRDVPEPVPELDDDQELLEALRRAYRDDPSKVREAYQAILDAEAEASGLRAEAEKSSSRRRAG